MLSQAITVFGSSQPPPGSKAYEQARQLGRLLGRAGFVVVNGGYTGTMEAVSRGATEAGGQAVGITCAVFEKRRTGPNPYLSQVVHTPTLLARLQQLVERASAFVVLGGGVGTLLELFLVWNLLAVGELPPLPARGEQTPVVLVGSHWQRVLADLAHHTEIEPRHLRMLQVVDTPEEAVRWIQNALDPRAG